VVKTLAPEVAEEGVTVNALLPGYTATARIAELGVPEEALAEHIPARRLGRPEELGAMAAFLASEQAGYVTGQAIAVDGGFVRGL
jgi:3-oxoacyl-[acyl-carrier protein] reductase